MGVRGVRMVHEPLCSSDLSPPFSSSSSTHLGGALALVCSCTFSSYGALVIGGRGTLTLREQWMGVRMVSMATTGEGDGVARWRA